MDFTLYNKLFTAFIDWLFPSYCSECQAQKENQQLVCETCSVHLPVPVNPCIICAVEVPSDANICGQCVGSHRWFDHCISAFQYQGHIREQILNLKSSGGRRFVGQLCHPLIELVSHNSVVTPEVILPVPMHCVSLQNRGFNQATMLAKYVGQQLNIPVDRNLIAKARQSPKQTGLNLKQRKINVRNTFELKKSNTYRRVILIDDVITTTATISEISKILKKNGVDYIEVWSIARAS